MEGRLLLGIGTGQKRNLLFCEVIMDIEEALKVLSSALQNDPYYVRVAPYHESNARAEKDFMKRVCGVDTTQGSAKAEIRNTCEERENLLPNSIDFEEYMDSFAIHVLAECVQNRLKQKRQEGQAGWLSTKDVVDVVCYAAMLLAQKYLQDAERDVESLFDGLVTSQGFSGSVEQVLNKHEMKTITHAELERSLRKTHKPYEVGAIIRSMIQANDIVFTRYMGTMPVYTVQREGVM